MRKSLPRKAKPKHLSNFTPPSPSPDAIPDSPPSPHISSSPMDIGEEVEEEQHHSQGTSSSAYTTHSPFRANVVASIKYIPGIKLRKPHIELLKETPFWLFVNALLQNHLKKDVCKKVDSALEKIIRQYQGNGTFKIGSKMVQLRRSDVKLIFGISCGTRELTGVYAHKSSVRIARRLKVEDNFSPKIIRREVTKLLKSDTPRDVKDVCLLVCIFICESLFMTTTANKLAWTLTRSLENWNGMKKNDWCRAILDMLVKSLDEESQTRPRHVTGCGILLLYWLCEHTKLLEPKNGPQVPRLLKWDITRLTLHNIDLENIPDEEVNDNELTESTEEILIYANRIGEMNIAEEDDEEEQEPEQQEGQVGVEQEEEEVGVEEEEHHPEDGRQGEENEQEGVEGEVQVQQEEEEHQQEDEGGEQEEQEEVQEEEEEHQQEDEGGEQEEQEEEAHEREEVLERHEEEDETNLEINFQQIETDPFDNSEVVEHAEAAASFTQEVNSVFDDLAQSLMNMKSESQKLEEENVLQKERIRELVEENKQLNEKVIQIHHHNEHMERNRTSEIQMLKSKMEALQKEKHVAEALMNVYKKEVKRITQVAESFDQQQEEDNEEMEEEMLLNNLGDHGADVLLDSHLPIYDSDDEELDSEYDSDKMDDEEQALRLIGHHEDQQMEDVNDELEQVDCMLVFPDSPNNSPSSHV